MRLRARRPLAVTVEDLDLRVQLEQGEEIRTEISAKFRREGVEAELSAAGFEMAQWWTDDQRRFALSLAQAV